MTSYDDDPIYRARPRSRQSRDDEYGRDPYEGYSEPTTRGAAGRAQVGRASVGGSSGGGYGSGYGDPGRAEPTSGLGRASVGRASVGSPRPTSPAEPVYGAPYGESDYGAYASVDDGSPVSPARTVGRAQVRPVSPSGPPVPGPGAGGGGGRGPGGPGGPGRPPVPSRPGGEGPDDEGGWRRPFRSFGLGGGRRKDRPGGKGDKDRSPEAVRKRRMARIRNISISAVALLVMLTGGGFVAGTLLVDSVALGEALPIPETSTIYYADGPVLGRLGENTRYVVPYEKMSPYVTEAIVASEDRTFWTNEGVDFRGVIRAAWNNITGGATQGASTITQQYARVAFDLKGATYNRKLREAVLAWKMSDELSKTDILSSYLNSVPFGRHAFGAEAAARAFFKKSIVADAAPEQRITRSEAMALVAMVKQPYADAVSPIKYPGYDPTRGCAPGEQPTSAWPECTEDGITMRANAVKNATDRWEYVRGGLVDLARADPEHFTLTAEEAATLQFPTFVAEDAVEGEGLDKPAGLVVKHILDELSHSQGNPTFSGMAWQAIRDGGFEIITTLDSRAQSAAESAADATIPNSLMYGQPDYMQAAVVSIDPHTGGVVAYYGGHVGTDVDFAGIYQGEDGQWAGYGRHPPGSSFKVYTLATALKNGYSLNSYWQWLPHPNEGRDPNNPIRNSADCNSDLLTDAKGDPIRGYYKNADDTYSDPEFKYRSGSPTRYLAYSGLCSLLEATVHSLNIPFYDLTARMGATKVLQTAYEAGVKHIWNNDLTRIDLDELGSIDEAAGKGIGPEVGIGQFAITPLEHANGIATFANGGLPVTAHFVKEVRKDGHTLFAESLPNPDAARVLNPQQVNDLTYAMSQVYPNHDAAGFQVATKTGTWEWYDGIQNAHAWNVGFTKNLATVVYVGSKGAEQPLKDKDGRNVYGSVLPRPIWMKFMTDAQNMIGYPKENTRFNPPSWVGDENPPGSYPSPTPPAPPTPTDTATSSVPTGTPTSGSTSAVPTGTGTGTGGGGGGGGGGGPPSSG